MKSAILFCVLLAAHVAWAPPSVPPELQQALASIHVMVEGLFTKADLNNNGQFDTSDIAAIFDEYDTNHDGRVTQDEFITRFMQNFPDRLEMKVVALGLFLDVDMNDNHVLEQADFPLYFNKVDTDDDGRISHQEFVNYFQQIFEVLFILALRENANLKATTPAP